MLAGGDRFTVGDATDAPSRYERFVPDDQRPKYEGWVRATFGPGAAKLGFVPQADTTTSTPSDAREALVATVAWFGRDPELVKQAVDLAGELARPPRRDPRHRAARSPPMPSPNVHAQAPARREDRARSRRAEARCSSRSARCAMPSATRPRSSCCSIRRSTSARRARCSRVSIDRGDARGRRAVLARAQGASCSRACRRTRSPAAAGLMVGCCSPRAATRRRATRPRSTCTEHFAKLSGAKRVIDQGSRRWISASRARKLRRARARGWLSAQARRSSKAPAKPAPAKPAKP